MSFKYPSQLPSYSSHPFLFFNFTFLPQPHTATFALSPYLNAHAHAHMRTRKRTRTQIQPSPSFLPPGLIISLQLLRGELEQIRRENQAVFNRALALTRKLGFPDVILPGKEAKSSGQ